MKAANAAITSGEVFNEIGSNAEPVGTSAFGRLDSIAKETVAKNESGMTYHKAFEKALSDNPDLYTNYLNEKEA